MSGSLVALLAAAINQVQNPDGSPVSLERTLGLLARAAEGGPIVLACTPAGIEVNDELLSDPFPGVALLSDALTSHHTGRLQLPGSMEPRHWRDMVELYAGAPALFASSSQVLAALRVSLPMAEIWPRHGLSSQPTAPPRNPQLADTAVHPAQDGLSTRGGNLGNFSASLTQLHDAGTAAAKSDNLEDLAKVLLGFRALERTGDQAQASVIAKERRRVISPAILDWLLREITKPGVPVTLIESMATLGGEELERILEALGHTNNPRERDVLARIFEHVHDQQALVLHSLRTGSPAAIRGAADIAGRRQITATIPVLAGLLRHSDADVRTAAWRALESIGTRDAIEALSTKGR